MSRFDNVKPESPKPTRGTSIVFELIEDLNKALATYVMLESKLDSNIDKIGHSNPVNSEEKVSDKRAPSNLIEKLEDSLFMLHSINARMESNLSRLEQFI